MASGDVLVDVNDVGLTLGGNLILDGVNFQIHDRERPGAVTGQIAAMLGPSGVGKTRLLRILAGLDSPDRGKVTGLGGAPLLAGENPQLDLHPARTRKRIPPSAAFHDLSPSLPRRARTRAIW